jgi:hypothetical protein
MAARHHRYAPVCQSCGMPMERAEHFGTEADGRHTTRYCLFCYKGGKFTEPDATAESMIPKMADEIVRTQHLTPERAEEVARELIGTLKRWYAPPAEGEQGGGRAG